MQLLTGAGWRKAFKFAIAMFVRFRGRLKAFSALCPWHVETNKRLRKYFRKDFYSTTMEKDALISMNVQEDCIIVAYDRFVKTQKVVLNVLMNQK